MNLSKILLAGVALFALMPVAQAADTLNVLTWCDHEDPALLEPFEQANGVKINFKDIDSTAAILAVLGQSRLLERRRVLGAAVDLRNPYVDALSHLQLRALAALRAGVDDVSEERRLRDLLLLTVNGVAAGLQNTG